MIQIGQRACSLCGEVSEYGLNMTPRGETVTICLSCLNNTIKPIIDSENERAESDGYKALSDKCRH